MSFLSRIGAAIRARLVTIAVWALIIVGVFVAVSVNRSNQARTEAALSSENPAVRDGIVSSLVQGSRLTDALTATQNPNEDAKSDQNVESVKIRTNAADSVNRLTAANKIAPPRAMETMFLLCKDSETAIKDKAKDGLAALGGQNDANLNAIVGRLKDGDPDIRGAAVDVLGKIGGDKVAKVVDPLLQDPAAADSAQSTMTKVGAPAVPYLVKHLDSPDVTFRQKMVTMLGQIASPGSVPELSRLAMDKTQPSIRRVALTALASAVLTNYNNAQKTTDDAAKAAKDPKAKPSDVQKAKEAAQKAASDFAQTRAAEPALVDALKNSEDDSQARTQAALALGRTGGPAAISALVASLGDFDARVKQAALAGVQSVGPPAAPPLTAALARGTEDTRAAAAQALGGIGTPAAVASLKGVLANPATPVSVRRSAVVGLGQSGNPQVISSLVAALGAPEGSVQSAASDAITSSQALETAAVPALVASFAKPTPVPINASQTLSRMGDLAVPALVAATKNPNPSVQTWAAVSLGQTESKKPEVLAALAPLKANANPGVQFAATEALTRLSGS